MLREILNELEEMTLFHSLVRVLRPPGKTMEPLRKSPNSPTSCSCHSVRFCISESPSGPGEEREQPMRRGDTGDGTGWVSGALERLLRETTPPLTSNQKARGKGQLPRSGRSGQQPLWPRQSHVPHGGAWSSGHPCGPRNSRSHVHLAGVCGTRGRTSSRARRCWTGAAG